MSGGHPIADEQDDIPRLAWPRVIDGPGDLTRICPIRGPHPVNAGLAEGDIAQDEG